MTIQDYILAEKSIHNYAKIIGSITDLFVEKEEGYSHTNMAWDNEERILISREINLPNNFVANIEYHPNHFHFHINTNCPNLKDP